MAKNRLFTFFAIKVLFLQLFLLGWSISKLACNAQQQNVFERNSTITKEPVYQNYEVQCPLPPEFHIRNKGGIDGAGLCVWASINHAAYWQNVEKLKGIFEYMRTQPGGGWYQKVEKYMKKFNYDNYIQVEGMENCIKLLEYAAKTNRMACITYGWDRSGAKIAHMVNCVFYGDMCCALDNNYPGTWEWMTKDEFLKRLKSAHLGGDASWVIVLLDDPPPPVPIGIK
jgi:hypothetical protein